MRNVEAAGCVRVVKSDESDAEFERVSEIFCDSLFSRYNWLRAAHEFFRIRFFYGCQG